MNTSDQTNVLLALIKEVRARCFEDRDEEETAMIVPEIMKRFR